MKEEAGQTNKHMAISQWGEKFCEIVFDNLNHKIFNKTSELFTQLHRLLYIYFYSQTVRII